MNAAEFVEKYLGTFIHHMIRGGSNSATGDNCRQAAEWMIEAAIAEERVRCAALVLTLKRLADSAELLAHELADPGSEALDAIYCARAVLANVGVPRDIGI